MKLSDFLRKDPSGTYKRLDEKYQGLDYKSILSRPHFTDNSIYDVSDFMSYPLADKKRANINLEVIAREKLGKKLRPYIKLENGELRELTQSDINEEIVDTFISAKNGKQSLVIVWYGPRMVKLAESPIKSKISEITRYEKEKADLYRAIDDLEKNHLIFLKEIEIEIQSVLERGHNFIL